VWFSSPRPQPGRLSESCGVSDEEGPGGEGDPPVGGSELPLGGGALGVTAGASEDEAGAVCAEGGVTTTVAAVGGEGCCTGGWLGGEGVTGFGVGVTLGFGFGFGAGLGWECCFGGVDDGADTAGCDGACGW